MSGTFLSDIWLMVSTPSFVSEHCTLFPELVKLTFAGKVPAAVYEPVKAFSETIVDETNASLPNSSPLTYALICVVIGRPS